MSTNPEMQVIHPFYVFQIASIILWSLDDYYYYAFCIALISALSIATSLVETKKVLFSNLPTARSDNHPDNQPHARHVTIFMPIASLLSRRMYALNLASMQATLMFIFQGLSVAPQISRQATSSIYPPLSYPSSQRIYSFYLATQSSMKACLLERVYLSARYPSSLRISRDGLMALGRMPSHSYTAGHVSYESVVS